MGNKGWRRHLHSIGRQSRNPPRFVSLGMVELEYTRGVRGKITLGEIGG